MVAFAIYTLHNKTLKLSAQLFPLFPKESRDIHLEVKKGDQWKKIATTKVNDLGWSGLFRLEQWDDSVDVPYRVRHGAKAMFEGAIRKNPKDHEEIVVANLSCNSSRDRMGRENMVRNLKIINPDMLFFAGDQHYDHTEHTAGWLMWGMQFRDVLKDRPVVTIPDDHDVGQGNLWGEGGIKGKGIGNFGGYIYDAAYVKQVERCQTAHLPDPYDPTPVAQGIGVYYTNYNLGGVDFAILEDRKFKSGPNGKINNPNSRVDHIRDPEFDTKSLDKPGLTLLGERQLKFLHQWGTDWKADVQMKAVLSQSPFCGGAHLHGGSDPAKSRLIADLDCNGWPQTGRNKAIKAMRKSFAVHLAGDQHLAILAQYGVDEFRDASWALVSPSIVGKVYGRRWLPLGEKAGANRDPKSPLPWTGDYYDGLHNRLTMYAYANPDKVYKGSGFCRGALQQRKQTNHSRVLTRIMDLSKADAHQYTGWPRVIDQLDNFRPKDWGTLGKLTFNRENPVVQLLDAESGKVIYTLRIKGKPSPHTPLKRARLPSRQGWMHRALLWPRASVQKGLSPGQSSSRYNLKPVDRSLSPHGCDSSLLTSLASLAHINKRLDA